MRKTIQWVRDKIHRLMIALAFSLKRTEEQILHQSGNADNISDEQNVNENRVSKALLKGEVTQEVKQLRYRTYKVDEEAKEQEYYSPLKSIKRDKQDNRHVKYKNPENCTLILIQPNKADSESVYESINKFNNKEKEPQGYTIKIKRNFVPRFRIEEYTRRIALFKRSDGATVIDFYISMYPDPTEFKSKAFIREIKEIITNKRKSDITDFSEFSFETYKCYNSEDYQEYTIKKCKLAEFDEYDGNHIFRYVTKEQPIIINNRLSDVFYDAEMDKRYREKAKKTVILDFNPYDESNKKKYTCTKCGKTFYYDLNEIDEAEPDEPRLINEECKKESETTSFLDAEITEQSTGQVLCKECLQKEYEKIVSKLSENI